MADTPVLSLPLLAPAQAQKHVTVNEALSRIDGLAQLCLVSASLTAPPVAAPEGEVYAVPIGATNAWSGQDGNLAISLNGGWVFVAPKRGWRAMILDQGVTAIWDGSFWRAGAATLTPGGASMALRSVEVDVDLTAGPSVTSPILFPSRSIAFGVTGRVTDAITGTATAWDLGISGDTQRYGNGLGLALNTWVNGPSAPLVYWSPTALEISAAGGDFAGGTIRLIAHFAELAIPDAI
jgi:hypothetical protein